ncbi:lysine--tRNA ligase [Pseudobdellovibrio exovorus]|uniref:Lysine--tRNA ligase n=1 Tax=Pseudobdellovibrio exovorus JSS TaxID=1184267 RepID=M4V7P4_9BACT|nr:lysine--tRNA ligase [Pseudobdellovibrio exovorus]AGH95238.1 lysyl-tRNA synthetase [Pseudobdellovibrio exovorus JSS]
MSDLNDNPIKAEKRKKLHALKEKGINPYPYSFDKTAHIEKIIADFSSIAAGEKKTESVFRIAGRLMTKREMGKASFFNVQDMTGTLQCYVKVEELSEKDKTAFGLIDLGDIVGLEGYVFKSQKGELSLYVKTFEVLTKTLEPLPEKFHGIQDVEIKYRHRHLDLISDPESREVFVKRGKIIKAIKRFLDDRGFMEVETPVLQPLYGGAAAHPFTTHHRALDMKLYMKISPELYLKRLIVGGFEKVYEIGKNFRNEGIDRSHNPEFTMLEFYEAYTDYNYQMTQFEELVSTVCKEITGSTTVNYQGKEVNFAPPWRRLTVLDGIKQYAEIDPQDDAALDSYLKANSDKPVHLDKLSRGEKQMKVFEIAAEPHLWQPTFVMDHPVEISPLTKIHRDNSALVERFEPFAACMEIGNSYSELNDPEEQRARLKEQESKRGHDEEAHPMDEDFLHAIETGMPPTGGVGLGIERIVMILTDRPSIRDIIFFPTMKISR